MSSQCSSFICLLVAELSWLTDKDEFTQQMRFEPVYVDETQIISFPLAPLHPFINSSCYEVV